MQTAAPIVVVVAVFLAFAAGAVIAHKRGYKDTGNAYARCRRGHLFETVWVPGRTRFRMVHLGWTRIQRCPVGGHLTLVGKVEASTLTSEQKKAARDVHDEFARGDGRVGGRADAKAGAGAKADAETAAATGAKAEDGKGSSGHSKTRRRS